MAKGDRLNLIYLAGLDYAASGYQNKAVAAIRSIRATLGSDSSFGGAKDAVDMFQQNPTVKLLIDANDDAELVQQAVEGAANHHQGAAVFEVNPDSLDLTDPEAAAPEDEDAEQGFSSPAYKTAMALLAMSDGNPTSAFYRAAKLGQTTDDMDFYKEVMGAIVSVFPLMDMPGVTVVE